MNIGIITCCYHLAIYGYEYPTPFDWGKMCGDYRSDYTKEDFLALAKKIRGFGYDSLEIWEPMFSSRVYSEADAREMSEKLREMGYKAIAYCVGGLCGEGAAEVDNYFAFAAALGCRVVTGCLDIAQSERLLPIIQSAAEKYNLCYAIENHPKPNFYDPAEIAALTKSYSRIGANFDSGIYNAMGYDIGAALDILCDKIFHVHLKDTTKHDGACHPLSEGDTGCDVVIKKLNARGFDGIVSAEIEAAGNPDEAVKRSFEFMRGCL